MAEDTDDVVVGATGGKTPEEAVNPQKFLDELQKSNKELASKMANLETKFTEVTNENASLRQRMQELEIQDEPDIEPTAPARTPNNNDGEIPQVILDTMETNAKEGAKMLVKWNQEQIQKSSQTIQQSILTSMQKQKHIENYLSEVFEKNPDILPMRKLIESGASDLIAKGIPVIKAIGIAVGEAEKAIGSVKTAKGKAPSGAIGETDANKTTPPPPIEKIETQTEYVSNREAKLRSKVL